MWLVGFPNCLTLENGDILPLGALVTWVASLTHPISVREDGKESRRVLEPLGRAESAGKIRVLQGRGGEVLPALLREVAAVPVKLCRVAYPRLF